ncbi:hypothetical protein [Azospirillum largimobile]
MVLVGGVLCPLPIPPPPLAGEGVGALREYSGSSLSREAGEG